MTKIDAASSWLTVERKDGTEKTYDPRRQQGVSVYREEERASTVSRGAYDAQLFTNDSEKLGAALRCDVTPKRPCPGVDARAVRPATGVGDRARLRLGNQYVTLICPE